MNENSGQGSARIQSNGREYEMFSTSIDEYIVSKLRKDGCFYEEDLLIALCRLAIGAGVFVDVGANIGNHSIFFAGEMEREVYAFELDDRNFRLLRSNIKLNRLEFRVRAFSLGISDTEGVLRFERNARNSGATRVTPEKGPFDGEASGVRLDDFFSEIEASGEFKQSIALIKIDVEGHEMQVLRGGSAVIARHKPIVVVEIHDSVGFQKIFRFLQQFEYAPVLVGANSDTYVFCHRGAHKAQSDLTTQYYTRMFEKRASSQSRRALAFSKEFNRIKGLLASLYESNRRLRADLRTSEGRIVELELLRAAWESETSRLCGVIQKYRSEAEAAEARISTRGSRSFFHSSDEKGSLPELQPQYISAIRKQVLERVAIDVASVPKPKAPVDFAESGAALPKRAALIVDEENIDRLADAILDLRSSGFRNFDIYTSGSIIVASNVTLIPVDDKLEALEHIMAAVPFSPVLLLDLTSPVDPRDAIEWFAASLGDASPQDIVVLDGLVLKPGEDGKSLSTQNYSMADSISSHIDVAVPFSLNMYLPRAVWIERGKRATSNLLVQFAKSAIDDRARFRLLARPPISVTDNVEVPDFSADLNILGAASRRASDGFAKRLAIVGRLDEERWHKGGIFHSCRAYAEVCERLEINSQLIEIDQAPADILRQCGRSRAVFLYTGDQQAQDFFNVVPLLEVLDERGHQVVVNLSYDTYPERTKEIVEVMKTRSDNVKLMLFSDDPLSDPALEPLAGRLVVVPKTIRKVPRRELVFRETSGIFMGDLGKFINPRITKDAEYSYRAIRECLPGVPILFLQQYSHKLALPAWLVGHEILPYSSDITEHFGQARVYLHAQNYCTFEMLPVEATIAGVPVVYCDMPQSLNSYIGNFGVRYDSLPGMQRELERMYSDESVWMMMSRAATDCLLVNSQRQQDKLFKLAFGPLL